MACSRPPQSPAKESAPVLPSLVDAAQAVKALAISPRKLWQMTAAGEVPCVRLGRSVRYSVQDLCLTVAANTEGGVQ